MIEADDIRRKLQLAAHARVPVTLINEYKGLPITYRAYVLRVGRQTATFDVHKYQAVCLEREGYTFIRDEVFPQPVKASVVTVNVHREVTTLTGFTYVSHSVGERRIIRVQPAEPTMIELCDQDGENCVPGELIDISERGIGSEIHVTVELPAERIIAVDGRVQVYLWLPTGQHDSVTEVEVTGVIVNVIPSDDSVPSSNNVVNGNGGKSISQEGQRSYRVGIRLLPEIRAEAKATIKQYVYSRELELMRELKRRYEWHVAVRAESAEVE